MGSEQSTTAESSGESPPAIDASPDGDPDEVPISAPAAEPPRRRLVAELLAGQEDIEESVRRDPQKAELHFETVDEGQPIYQLDLSSEEPQGTLVEPTRRPELDADAPIDHHSAIAAGAVHNAVKQLVMQRDRQVMAAERDGVGAYELAVDLDTFVERVVDAVRRAGR